SSRLPTSNPNSYEFSSSRQRLVRRAHPIVLWSGLLPFSPPLACLHAPYPLEQWRVALLRIRRCEPANTFENERLVRRIQPPFYRRWHVESGCCPLSKDELPS